MRFIEYSALLYSMGEQFRPSRTGIAHPYIVSLHWKFPWCTGNYSLLANSLQYYTIGNVVNNCAENQIHEHNIQTDCNTKFYWFLLILFFCMLLWLMSSVTQFRSFHPRPRAAFPWPAAIDPAFPHQAHQTRDQQGEKLKITPPALCYTKEVADCVSLISQAKCVCVGH